MPVDWRDRNGGAILPDTRLNPSGHDAASPLAPEVDEVVGIPVARDGDFGVFDVVRVDEICDQMKTKCPYM